MMRIPRTSPRGGFAFSVKWKRRYGGRMVGSKHEQAQKKREPFNHMHGVEIITEVTAAEVFWARIALRLAEKTS